jgi:hypothetical protein
VRAHPLPSYQIHEECFRLDEGDRVEFRFESTEPVDFNLPLPRRPRGGDADIAREVDRSTPACISRRSRRITA